jgi:hypothetical protein
VIQSTKAGDKNEIIKGREKGRKKEGGQILFFLIAMTKNILYVFSPFSSHTYESLSDGSQRN